MLNKELKYLVWTLILVLSQYTLSIWRFTISDEMDECKDTLKIIFTEIKKL